MRLARGVRRLPSALFLAALAVVAPTSVTVAQATDYADPRRLAFDDVGCQGDLKKEQGEPRYRGWGWPPKLPPSRRTAIEREQKIERAWRCELIAVLSIVKQKQQLGTDDPDVLEAEFNDFVTGVPAGYEKWVLERRLALAPLGCYEAVWALEGYLQRGQTLQLLGLSPEGGPVSESMTLLESMGVPERLWPTIVDRCFDEQYRRCVDTGDFQGLVGFLLSFERQVELTGRAVDPAEDALGRQVLERCGRWRLRLDTSYLGRVDGTVEIEAGREFEVAWRPGGGAFGLAGSVIDGEGPVESRKLSHRNRSERCRETRIEPGAPARGEIRGALFEVDPDEWPRPRGLDVMVNFGTTEYVLTCWDRLSGILLYKFDRPLDYEHGLWAVTGRSSRPERRPRRASRRTSTRRPGSSAKDRSGRPRRPRCGKGRSLPGSR